MSYLNILIEQVLTELQIDNAIVDACWIKPDGEVLHVPHYGHAGDYLLWLKENSPKEFNKLCKKHDTDNIMELSRNEREITSIAKKKGWIRYLFVGMDHFRMLFDCDYLMTFEYVNLTPQAAKTCLKFLYQNAKMQKMKVEIGPNNQYRMVSYREAIAFFKSV